MDDALGAVRRSGGFAGRLGSSRTRTRSTLAAVALLAAVAVVVLAGVFAVTAFGQHGASVPPVSTPPPLSTQPSTVVVPSHVSMTPAGLVVALGEITPSFASPNGRAGKAIAPTWHGLPLYLPVVAIRSRDLEVRLPTRPNGSMVWIREAGVRLFRSRYRIVIDLASRHLLLYRDGVVVLDAPAGIGTATDPTPIGDFFVVSFATAPSPAWGPFVIVTSAHSDAITDWEESGDAVVAIHGPLGEDAEIGTTGARISHGCIRLHDEALAQLRVVPDGSPIDIIA